MINDRTEASQPTRRRLGRGLDSLIGTRVPVAPPHPDAGATATATAPMNRPTPSPGNRPAASRTAAESGLVADPGADGSSIRMLPVDRIGPNPTQPRQDFNEEALEALAASIRTAGVMQPVVVRETSGAGGGAFELIVGERRLRAARRAGLKEIPAIVRSVDDRTAAEWALIENIQREDLNPVERAEAFRKLIEQHGLTHQDLAERVSLNRSSVTNLLRILELDDATREDVRAGRLSTGHAKVLLGVPILAARRAMAELAVKRGWSVRALEERVAGLAEKRRPAKSGGGAGRSSRANLQALARRIGEQLGTRVTIVPGKTAESGRLVIEFYDLDQFDGLMQRLGVEPE